jgi:hypothetical protein
MLSAIPADGTIARTESPLGRRPTGLENFLANQVCDRDGRG